MDFEKRKRLNQKREIWQNEIKESNRMERASDFIRSLKQINGSVEELAFPKREVIKYTWNEKVSVAYFELLPFKSEENKDQLLMILEEWISSQQTDIIYLSNQNLESYNQWIKIKKTDLLRKLGPIFDQLRLYEEIIMSNDTNTFLSLADFDNKIRLMAR